MGDPFLNYFALGLLCFVVVVMFYGIIAIHDRMTSFNPDKTWKKVTDTVPTQ